MSKIDITVEPKDKVRDFWEVYLFTWNPKTKKTVNRKIGQFLTSDKGKTFTASTVSDVPPGEHHLLLMVAGSGNKVSAKIDSAPTVTSPFGSKWPLVVENENRTQGDGTYLFLQP